MIEILFLLFALKSFGVLESNFITNWSIQIGAFSLLVLFSIAVPDRINKEKKAKFLAKEYITIHQKVEKFRSNHGWINATQKLQDTFKQINLDSDDNKEQIPEHRKQFIENNKIRLKVRSKKYYDEDKEQILEIMKQNNKNKR